jgi:lipopolysaccharide/colanic/teichoic acid biosynthesis glycosyltransferase
MNYKFRYSVLAADLLWVVASFAAAQILRNGLTANQRAGLSLSVDGPPILVSFSVWILLYFSEKLEAYCVGSYLPSAFARLVVGVFYIIGSLLALAFLVRPYYAHLPFLYLGCLLPLGFVSIRCLAWWLVTSRSRTGAKRRVVILGSGRIPRELALKISRHPEMSMEVAGILFPSDTEPSSRVTNWPSGTMSIRTLKILNLMQGKKVQELIVVEPLPRGPETEKLISTCRKAGMRVHLVPQHYELYLSKAKLTEIDDVPLLSLEELTLSAVGLGLKRAIDILGALFLMVFAAPLLVLSVAALRWKKRTAFRRELRCGKNGNPFWMYRLNIDRDAPVLDGFERVLVRFSLTELPQLWNALKGDMSLVGPRPESTERVKHYSMWQRQRLTVTPGLTGLAQVNGLREEHSSEEKAHFDLQYIFHWSVFLDLSLVLETLWTLLVRVMEKDEYAAPPSLKLKVDPEFVIPKVLNAHST